MRWPTLLLALGLALLASAPAVAASRGSREAELRETLDALLALERDDGGWTYEQGEGVRPRPSTMPLRIAERIAGTVGLATWDTVVMRSPGTPAAGLLLLDAYDLTDHEEYLDAAVRTGDIVLAAQLRSGGWFSEAPMEEGTMAAWFAVPIRRSSLDDDVTTGAVRLLLELWTRTKERRYWYAATQGLELLKAAQLSSGAWPLVWRPMWKQTLIPTFEDRATLNDGATSLEIQTFVLGGRVLDRADFTQVALRGGDWLIRAQRAAPRAGWAQQYDDAGHPTHARRFEPPALATWETRYAMEALLALATATGEQKYCAPLTKAVSWLQRAALRDGCWARFYDLDTGEPLYVDDDGRHVASPAEAHRPYDWQGDFGVSHVLRRLGAKRAGRSPLPIRPVAGDPIWCRDAERLPFDARKAGDPRLLVAHAARVLGTLQPTVPNPCK